MAEVRFRCCRHAHPLIHITVIILCHGSVKEHSVWLSSRSTRSVHLKRQRPLADLPDPSSQATTGLDLQYIQYGKPHAVTYDFAQEMIMKHLQDIGRGGEMSGNVKPSV